MAGKGVSEVVNRCERAKTSGFLDLTGCGLVAIPQAVYFLVKGFEIHSCSLKNNELAKFPKKLPEKLPHLRLLNMSGNLLQELPEEIETLAAIKSLDLSHNKMSNFPYGVLNLAEIENLNLEGNSIEGNFISPLEGVREVDIPFIFSSGIDDGKIESPRPIKLTINLKDNPLVKKTDLTSKSIKIIF